MDYFAGLDISMDETRMLTSPGILKGVPLIHDDSLSSRAFMPNWADWFAAAGVRDTDPAGVVVVRKLRRQVQERTAATGGTPDPPRDFT